MDRPSLLGTGHERITYSLTDQGQVASLWILGASPSTAFAQAKPRRIFVAGPRLRAFRLSLSKTEIALARGKIKGEKAEFVEG